MVLQRSCLATVVLVLISLSTSFAFPDTQTPQDSIVDRFVEEIQKNMTSDVQYARDLCMQALTRAREGDSPQREIQILNLLAECDFRLGKYAESVETSTESIRINTPVKDSVLLANTYRNLGNVHTFGLKQYEEALRYQLLALEIYQQKNDKKMIAAQYGSITWIYGITGTKTEEGMAMATAGIRIATEINDAQLLAYNYNSKGIFFNQRQQYDSAIYVLEKSNDFATQANDKAVHAYNKTLIGEAYLKKNEPAKALAVFQEALQEATVLDIREVKKDAYLGMANAFEALGNTKEAFAHFRNYAALKDTLLNGEVSQKALFYKNRMEGERQQAVITQLEIEKNAALKEKQLLTLLFVLGMVLLVAILGSIGYVSHQRKRANKQLQEMNDAIHAQNLELEELNDTKDKLFSIIGHDLRSPIGNLKVLLELFKGNMMNAGELNSLLPKLNNSVGGLHEMLENLLEWSHSQMQGFKVHPETINVHALAETTLGYYQAAAEEKGISISIQVPDKLLALADKNHVLLIMRNLVNNAIKYTERGGHIVLGGMADGTKVRIFVRDSGVGIAADELLDIFEFKQGHSKTGTQGEKGTGFGLALCKEMVEANGGTIDVSSDPGNGSEFVFTLKGAP